MSQHDQVIANQAGAALRADLNSALAALFSQNSGATEPATMVAYQWWADTTTGLLKIRNAANSAWITVGTLASANLGLAALAGATFTGPVNEARGSVAMHATTMDLWAQPNIIDGTGSAVTITAIANAPQAGARRVLYPIANTVITNGAIFAVDGAANYTTAAGDALEFEAITTNTYKVHVTKKDGTSVVGATFASSAENIAGTVENKAVDPLGIREAFNCTGTAPVYACRAWVNFNGTGTVAINGSGNVSSITDNGVGDYTINFATAMPDANYAVSGLTRYDESGGAGPGVFVELSRHAQTASAVRIKTGTYNGALYDVMSAQINVFR